MHLPGFRAEGSLYDRGGPYRLRNDGRTSETGLPTVVPQMIREIMFAGCTAGCTAGAIYTGDWGYHDQCVSNCDRKYG